MTAEPATAAGRALLAEMQENPLPGARYAYLLVRGQIAAIEAEAARLALTPTVAGTVFHRWREETLAAAHPDAPDARYREALEALTSTLESVEFRVGILGMTCSQDDARRIAVAHTEARSALRDAAEPGAPGLVSSDFGTEREPPGDAG